VLVDGALVGPRDHFGSFVLVTSRDVKAFPGEHSVDDAVALEDPLLAGLAPERLKADLVSLGGAFDGVLVETGPDDALSVEEPLLVGRVLNLSPVHDDLGPGVHGAPRNVQTPPVHLADDQEMTSSGNDRSARSAMHG